MPTVTVKPASIAIELTPSESFWGFHKSIEVWAPNVTGTQPLQINLTKHKYSRIVVGVPNAEALAEEINAAITGC
jgi:hypothetical protein